MSLTKLRCLASVLGRTNKNALVSRLSMRRTSAALLTCERTKTTATRDNNDDDDIDKPIRFSESGAARWRAEATRTGAQTDDDRPWFQTYVISASLAAFLIYFCVLREENDIDELLTRDLSDHFPEHQRENLRKSQQLSVDISRTYLANRTPTAD